MLGLGLVLPAGLALLVGYVVPSLYTLWLSFQDYHLLSAAEWTGIDNYQLIFEDERPMGFGFALSMAIIPLAVLLLVAPLLAWAAARAGRPARLTTRLVLTVPMVCFTPTAIFLAWLATQAEGSSWAWDLSLGDPELAPTHLRILLGLVLFGLLCGVGVTLYLSALRGYGPTWTAGPAVLTVAGLAVLTTVAVALQVFSIPVFTNGGPADATRTPMFALAESGLQRGTIGFASAQAMLLLVPLMVLGIAAALLVILTGMRLELTDRMPATGAVSQRDGVRTVALVITVVGLLAVLAVAAYGMWPWLSRQGWSAGDAGPMSTISLLTNTWVPPLVSTVVGVGLAAAAGFGIGALRPFGRHSELLLLVFAPWLFIGVGPLFLSRYEFARELGLVDTFPALIPPIWLVVPALFLFTVLFRGLERQRAAASNLDTDWVLLRSLPMLVLVGAATWLVQAQSMLWGYVVGRTPDSWTAPVWTYHLYSSTASSSDLQVGEVLPIPAVVIFAVLLGVLQVLYLDRLAIRLNREPIADLKS